MPVYLVLTNESIFSKEYLYPSQYRRRFHPTRSRHGFSLKKEIWEWARENKIKMKKVKKFPKDFKFQQSVIEGRWWESLEFINEEDATLFKLRWL